MYKTKLCLGINPSFCEDIKKQLDIIKATGFEAVFFGYRSDTPENIRYARQIGLEIQSIHAPFGGCADLWEGTEKKAREFTEKLLDCVKMCAENDVPLMVSHAYIGFDEHGEPNERGLTYYGRVIEEAKRLGIRIGFENTEGEEFLDAILTRFTDYDNVGFNWDTGHELCYNHASDMPGKYPGRLFGTHLNDNLGVKDFNGKIYWTDDLHLLLARELERAQPVAGGLHGDVFVVDQGVDQGAALVFKVHLLGQVGRAQADALLDRAALGGLLAEQDAQQGGLARAVVAQNGDPLAVADVERYIL